MSQAFFPFEIAFADLCLKFNDNSAQNYNYYQFWKQFVPSYFNLYYNEKINYKTILECTIECFLKDNLDFIKLFYENASEDQYLYFEEFEKIEKVIFESKTLRDMIIGKCTFMPIKMCLYEIDDNNKGYITLGKIVNSDNCYITLGQIKKVNKLMKQSSILKIESNLNSIFEYYIELY